MTNNLASSTPGYVDPTGNVPKTMTSGELPPMNQDWGTSTDGRINLLQEEASENLTSGQEWHTIPIGELNHIPEDSLTPAQQRKKSAAITFGVLKRIKEVADRITFEKDSEREMQELLKIRRTILLDWHCGRYQDVENEALNFYYNTYL